MKSSNAPIFIVGAARTGTTLLSTLIASHPRISISPETHYLNRWMTLYPNLTTENRRAFDVFWNAYSTSARFAHLGLDPKDVHDRILAAADYSHRAVFSAILESYSRLSDKPRSGEKTPTHFLHIDKLLEWFPQAKILFMMRDPRAVVSSLRETPWGPQNLYVNAVLWRDSALAAKRCSANPQIRLTRYEDLASTPEQELRSICRFLDEPYSNDLLTSTSSFRSVGRSGWAQTHHTSATHSPTPAHIDRWKAKLSEVEIATIDRLLHTDMESMGYACMAIKAKQSQLIAARLTTASYRLRRYTRERLFGRGARARTLEYVLGALKRRRDILTDTPTQSAVFSDEPPQQEPKSTPNP